MLNVILNETDIVKSVLEGKIENFNISVVLDVLLKHYYINGMNDRLKLREQLLDFLKNNYQGYKRAKWEDMITKKVNRFLKVIRQNKVDVKLIDIEEINITHSELESILVLNNIKLEKIAFIMLVYAKISNIIMNNHEGWINKSCSNIFKEAKVNLKGNEKEKILNDLYRLGYIKQRERNDKTNLKICYIDEGSDVEINITNFDSIINYYILWKNKDMIPCEQCGKPIKHTNNKKKYCKTCAREIKLENDKKIQRERYANQKFSQIETSM